jgi:hypothetical protein
MLIPAAFIACLAVSESFDSEFSDSNP